ncbi:MAG: sensor histidine kinase [Flavobacteriaceae bacterium]
MKPLISIFYFLFCFVYFSNGQSSLEENLALKKLVAHDFSEVKLTIVAIEDLEVKNSIQNLMQVMEHRGQMRYADSILVSKISPKNTLKIIEILNHLTLGFYILNNETDNYPGLVYFNTAYNLSKEIQNQELLKLSLLGIIELYTLQVVHSTDSYKEYIETFKALAENETDEAIATFYENSFYANSIHSPQVFFETSKKLLKITRNINLSSALQGRFYEDIAVYYRVINNQDSAYYYNQLILKLPDDIYNHKTKCYALFELANLAATQNRPKQAKEYLLEARNYFNKSNYEHSLYSWEKWKAQYVHEPLKEYDSAYYLLEKAMIYEAEKDFKTNKEKISALNVELQTAEKEKQILIEQQKKKQNQNIAIGLGGSLVTVSIIGFLLFKNTQRKQRIAEQEKELEIQKKEKILKDQELNAIDAMIAGQEKERERLASDLHDSVGATLSAAKLQFDHLSKNKEKLESMEELFQKTGTLLDQAYKEVRSMAHLKNSGVIAKKGLLPAIVTLAKNASATGQLSIEVQDFGLDEKLEPSLEITIFRIIQELVTNIIKHSEASEANISITQHQDMLSIIVEDNGKGFDVRQNHLKEGMGLGSIEKRIEHLEGTLEIDSTPHKGTSILIELPL